MSTTTPDKEKQRAEQRAAYIHDLRRLADFLEQRSDMPVPGYAGVTLTVFRHTREEFGELATRCGGALQERIGREWTTLYRRFGQHSYEITIRTADLLEVQDKTAEIGQFLQQITGRVETRNR
jgi:hypothetical protein